MGQSTGPSRIRGSLEGGRSYYSAEILSARPLKLSPRAETVRHVVFGDDQVIATIILTPDDDVGVRMSGVAVVYSNPIELGANVNFGLGHEIADERLEVSNFGTIFWRDNQPKLVTVIFAFSKESRTIGIIEVTAV